jgi:hypothetical protein
MFAVRKFQNMANGKPQAAAFSLSCSACGSPLNDFSSTVYYVDNQPERWRCFVKRNSGLNVIPGLTTAAVVVRETSAQQGTPALHGGVSRF